MAITLCLWLEPKTLTVGFARASEIKSKTFFLHFSAASVLKTCTLLTLSFLIKTHTKLQSSVRSGRPQESDCKTLPNLAVLLFWAAYTHGLWVLKALLHRGSSKLLATTKQQEQPQQRDCRRPLTWQRCTCSSSPSSALCSVSSAARSRS